MGFCVHFPFLVLKFCLSSTCESLLQIVNLCDIMCVSVSLIHLPTFAFTIISPLLPCRSLRWERFDFLKNLISYWVHSLHCLIMGLCVDYNPLQEEASLMRAELSTHLRLLRVKLLLHSNDSLRKHAIFVFWVRLPHSASFLAELIHLQISKFHFS